MVEPKVGEKYLHFKGMEVEVICVAKDCEDVERRVVVYKHYGDVKGLSGETIWVRELGDFCGYKKFKKDVEYEGKAFKARDEVKRFVLVEVDL